MEAMDTPRRFLAAALACAPLLGLAAEPMYPPVERAKADIEGALKDAAKAKKRVIVDFGGNWCTDCRILDINLKKPENAALLDKNFVMVHVNVGDKGISDNFDVAERFGIPLRRACRRWPSWRATAASSTRRRTASSNRCARWTRSR